MAEEKLQPELLEEAQQPMTADIYVEKLREINSTKVDKADYERLLKDREKLANELANGNIFASTDAKPEEQGRSIEELRKDFLTKEMNNLDYVTTALELRSKLMAKGEPDPFLPKGHEIDPTDSDVAAANSVGQLLQSCVEIAQGNSDIFTNELQRHLVDSVPIRRR